MCKTTQDFAHSSPNLTVPSEALPGPLEEYYSRAESTLFTVEIASGNMLPNATSSKRLILFIFINLLSLYILPSKYIHFINIDYWEPEENKRIWGH